MSAREILDRMRAVVASHTNPQIMAEVAGGRPVIGTTCTYVPREVLTAAGALGIHLRGSGNQDTDQADGFMSSRTCSYVRHVVNLAIEGQFSFLSGVVSANTCDHVRRATDVWKHKTAVGFVGFVSVPRNVRESLYAFYRQEVENLLHGLGQHLGVSIGPPQLADAIRLHNRVRRRLARLDALRWADDPPLTGADLLLATVSARALPPETFIAWADELLADPSGIVPPGPPRARLLLAGGELDEPDFVTLIEGQGGRVVADTLCCGMRAHEQMVDERAADPLEAICRHTFFQTSCARMIGNFPDRVEQLLRAVSERRVDGVIFQRLKFCDPWGGEGHNLRHRLRDLDLPLLVLEREYGRLNGGQVKTRVQAFLELLESRARRRAGSAGGGG